MVLCVFYFPFPWSFELYIFPSHGPLSLLFLFSSSFTALPSLPLLYFFTPSPSLQVKFLPSSYETSGWFLWISGSIYYHKPVIMLWYILPILLYLCCFIQTQFDWRITFEMWERKLTPQTLAYKNIIFKPFDS
jgi:hypothetical protein